MNAPLLFLACFLSFVVPSCSNGDAVPDLHSRMTAVLAIQDSELKDGRLITLAVDAAGHREGAVQIAMLIADQARRDAFLSDLSQ